MSIDHRADTGTIPAPSSASEARPRPEGSPRWRDRPRWEHLAVGALLAVTAALYLWNLSSSGWANSFYSAAVQAGSESWRAFLYGASDAAASITVDKPPASLWIMALSVRIFGLSSWSILVPQALMGVATVGVLYASVRRRFSAGAALIAGGVLALTPVAALMFRFNNPDALLVLLLTLAAAAALRAIEGPRTTRWMVVAGVLVGFAFLTKQLQAFLVLPPIALAFIWAAPISLGKRIRDGLLAVLAMVVAGGWWVALVELVPESWRPYIGGSQNNSFLELTFGYNGLGRITGEETGSVGGGQGGGWGSTGLTRLFDGEIGGQITWLIPAAVVLAAVALWLGRRAPRTDGRRAALIVWLGWLLVTALTFSFMAGIFHAYYTVALAPAVAALVGIGAAEVWRFRRVSWTIPLLAAVVIGTGVWAWVLLGRSADWFGWLRWTVLALSLVAAAALVAGRFLHPGHLARSLLRGGAVLALIAGLAGPTAYTLQTVSTGHTGSIVTAGPTVSGSSGGPGGGQGGGQGRGPGGGQGGGQMPGGTNGSTNGTPPGGFGGSSDGSAGSSDGTAGGSTGPSDGSTGAADGSAMTGGPGSGTGGGTGGGMGGLLGGTDVSDELADLLLTDADSYTWVAATVGSQNAASYQLATEQSVMPIGGFNGSDPSPTLAEFQELVADGQIHYFIAGGSMGQSDSGSDAASEITAWVEENYTAQDVDGVTLYDLSGD